MILSAKDLVKKYLELLLWGYNVEEWSEEFFSNNQPSYYRFRQLKILFDAYSLGNVADFEKGKFIEERPLKVYGELINMGNRFEGYPKLLYYQEEEHLDFWMVKKLFTKLIGYRKVISRAIHFNDGVLLDSGLFRFACDLIRHFNYSISKELEIIDDVLSFLISPSGKIFSVNELVITHGYPDVDIKAIDIDWA